MGTRGRVLLVGCSKTIAHLVRETLTRATGGPFELAHALRVSEALAQLRRAPSDVVLMDAGVPDAQVPDALERLLAQVHGIRIVLLVRPGETGVAQAALSKGATGVLVKDDLWELDAGRLVRTIEGAIRASGAAPEAKRLSIRMPRPSARGAPVLAFVGARGGAGTTRAALDVACALHDAGKRVSIVELGSAGTLAGWLGISPAPAPDPLEPRFATITDRFTAVVTGEHAPALDAARTERLLETLTRTNDAVVLDLPRDGSDAMRMALKWANAVSLVTAGDAACLRQARGMAATLRRLARQDASVAAVVVPHGGLVPKFEDLEKEIAMDVLAVVPPFEARADSAGGAAAVDDARDAVVRELVEKLVTAHAPRREPPGDPA